MFTLTIDTGFGQRERQELVKRLREVAEQLDRDEELDPTPYFTTGSWFTPIFDNDGNRVGQGKWEV